MKLKFTNIGSFFNDIKKTSSEFVKDTNKVVIETGAQMNADAIAKAPFKTGNLRVNIKNKKESDGVLHKSEVLSEADYSIYVEFGTGDRGEASDFQAKEEYTFAYTKGWPGKEAQPFFMPAYYKAEKDFINKINKIKKEYDGKQ